MAVSLAPVFNPLFKPLGKLRDRWLDRRLGRPGNRAYLHYRRVFILPSRGGLVFVLMLFAMWLGAVNYVSSMAFLLCFLLAGIGVVSMVHAFRNLAGLEIQAEAAEPVFAGGQAMFPLHVSERAGRRRYGLVFRYPGMPGQPLDAEPGIDTSLLLCVPAPTRGRLRLRQHTLRSGFPGGLVTTWSWLRFSAETVVYPKPETGLVPAPSSDGGEEESLHLSEGDEDFRGLRRYQPGDSLRRVAWRTLARGQELQTRQYADQTGSSIWLDWFSLAGLAPEARLSRLARWVLDAEADSRPFGLRLPGTEILPDSGPAHSARCLTALALMPAATAAEEHAGSSTGHAAAAGTGADTRSDSVSDTTTPSGIRGA